MNNYCAASGVLQKSDHQQNILPQFLIVRQMLIILFF